MAIASFTSQKEWVLLTSARLLFAQNGPVHSIDLHNIRDATVDLGPSMLRRPRSKRELRELIIETRSGDTYELDLEPGKPFFGFWNVMKLVAASSSNGPSAHLHVPQHMSNRCQA